MLARLLDAVRPDRTDRETGQDEANADGDGSAEDGDRHFWDLIPRWQYRGRHVESGGATKDEQERALEEIQAQADAIEATDALDQSTGDEHPGPDFHE